MKLRQFLGSAFLGLAMMIQPAVVAAQTPQRIALVIGNSKYDQSASPAGTVRLKELRNACDDAQAVAATLVKVGWADDDVTQRCDVKTSDMQALIATFNQKFLDNPGMVGFIYFAGHGVQIDDRTFLFGVDAAPNLEAARRHIDQQTGALLFTNSAIELSADILGRISDVADAGFSVLIDACRNDALMASLNNDGARRATNPNFSSTEYLGQLIAFSTQKNDVASDGIGARGPYAEALVKFLVGDERLTVTLNKVGRYVLTESRRRNPQKVQRPTFRGDTDRPCLVRCRDERVPASHDQSMWSPHPNFMKANYLQSPPVALPQSAVPATSAVTRAGVETMWRAIGSDGKSPRAGLLIDIWYCQGGAESADRETTARRIAAYLSEQAGEAAGSVREVRLRPLSVRGNSAAGFRHIENTLVFGSDDRIAPTWAKRLQVEAGNVFIERPAKVSGLLNVFVCSAVPRAAQARVFWHVAARSQIAEAQRFQYALDETNGGFRSIAQVEVVKVTPNETDVRFFFEEDRVAAFKLADSLQLLTGNVVRLQYLDGIQNQSRPGNIEVWLGTKAVPLASTPDLEAIKVRLGSTRGAASQNGILKQAPMPIRQ